MIPFWQLEGVAVKVWKSSHFPNHVIEQSLADAVGSEVERAYRRGTMFDKRRQLMEAWSRYCSTKPVADAGNVVAINR